MCRGIEVIQNDHYCYMVMEQYSGGTLKDYILKKGKSLKIKEHFLPLKRSNYSERFWSDTSQSLKECSSIEILKLQILWLKIMEILWLLILATVKWFWGKDLLFFIMLDPLPTWLQKVIILVDTAKKVIFGPLVLSFTKC